MLNENCIWSKVFVKVDHRLAWGSQNGGRLFLTSDVAGICIISPTEGKAHFSLRFFPAGSWSPSVVSYSRLQSVSLESHSSVSLVLRQWSVWLWCGHSLSLSVCCELSPCPHTITMDYINISLDTRRMNIRFHPKRYKNRPFKNKN